METANNSAAEQSKTVDNSFSENAFLENLAYLHQTNTATLAGDDLKEVNEYVQKKEAHFKTLNEKAGAESQAKTTQTTENKGDDQDPLTAADTAAGDDPGNEVDILGIFKAPSSSAAQSFDDATKQVITKAFGTDDVSVIVEKYQGYDTVKSDLENLQHELELLPDPLKEAIQALSEGRDFIEAFNRASKVPDFRASFKKQNTENLVQYYRGKRHNTLKKELEKGDLTAEDFQAEVDDLAEGLEDLFADDKKIYDAKITKIANDAKLENKTRQTAISDAISEAKRVIPGINESIIRQAERIIQNPSDLFYTQGKLNKDAILRVAYALHGDKLILAQSKKAATKAATEAASAESAKIIAGSQQQPGKNNENPDVGREKNIYLPSRENNDPYRMKSTRT